MQLRLFSTIFLWMILTHIHSTGPITGFLNGIVLNLPTPIPNRWLLCIWMRPNRDWTLLLRELRRENMTWIPEPGSMALVKMGSHLSIPQTLKETPVIRAGDWAEPFFF